MTDQRNHNEGSTNPGRSRIDLKAGRRAFMQSVGLGVAGAAMFGPGAVKPAAAQGVNIAGEQNPLS